MSGKICLQQNDFKEDVLNMFKILKEDKDFADVTLACQDGKQVEAHKVILASSSQVFQNILKDNNHAHPVIYMKGICADDLLAIIDFIYCGQTSVQEEDLSDFLAIAEDLKLKGFLDSGLWNEARSDTIIVENQASHPEDRDGESDGKITKQNNDIQLNEDFSLSDEKAQSEYEGSSIVEFSGNLEELKEQTNSMMSKTSKRGQKRGKGQESNAIYICKLCGKEGEKSNVRTHIEANHIKGFSIPCNDCPKTFR